MDKQRILKEAQKIAAKYSFWMVSGNISHLYGYVYEIPEKKYELEIKFDDNFPNSPPQLIFRDEIKELLGNVELEGLKKWNPSLLVVEIIEELKLKIQKSLNEPIIVEEELMPINAPIESKQQEEVPIQESNQQAIKQSSSEEYITPDPSAYPTEDTIQDSNAQNELSSDNTFSEQTDSNFIEDEHKIYGSGQEIAPKSASEEPTMEAESEPISVEANSELSNIQQYYAYEQKGKNPADLNIYLTITMSKTFLIGVNFTDYPEKPIITFPAEVKKILGDPNQSLETLRKWNPKKGPHVLVVLQEVEKKLLFIKDIESEAKKILGEYRGEQVEDNLTVLKVHLLTYGFKEYTLDVDLGTYPEPPTINLSEELKNIIHISPEDLNARKNWKEKESETVELIREISWLADQHSRISFEIDLLKEQYKDIEFNPSTSSLTFSMKGKMQTQDLSFKFQINLPLEYPMKIPEIKLLNEDDFEGREKVKSDLQTYIKSFFNEWTPFKYMMDLFNLISQKIFEISIVSCVICHKIECPSCKAKIAGGNEEPCHVDCPYCERSYHKHCWDQTIKSFGKCGFCLKTPPPSMM